MPTNPVEVNYQTGRTLYYFRSKLTSAGAEFYNQDTDLYETYDVLNWLGYAIDLPEVSPGYYRSIPPALSLSVPATEIIYEVQDTGVGPQVSDAPAIANGSSQGVNIGTVNGHQTSIGASNPVTDLVIANIALNHIGQKKLTSLADLTESARTFNLIYEMCRDSVFRDCSWKFATVIETLVELTAETVTGWDYVYTMPDDSLFIRKVYSDTSNQFDLPFFNGSSQLIPKSNPRGEQFKVVYQTGLGLQVIVANFNPAYIEYTARMIDSTLFDPMFVEALTYKLASKLAIRLSGDASQGKEMEQRYLAAIADARKVNGVEDPLTNTERSSYIDARG